MFRKYLTVRNCTIAVIVAAVLGGYAYTSFRDVSPGPDPEPTPNVSVEILGPTMARTGDLVVLAVDNAVAGSFAWTAIPEDCQRRVMDSGKVLVLVFSSPGKYVVVLAVGGSAEVIFVKHTITVQGDNPPPQPNPEPEPLPEPEPEPEPDESDWVRWTYETAIASVSSPSRATQATALANQFRSIAAKIAAGGIRTTKEARVELRAANNQALGKDAADWATFSSKFVGHCTDLEVAGELGTLKQYQEIYVATARGLDKVASKKTTDRRPSVTIITSPGCPPCEMLKSEYLPGAFRGIDLVILDRNRDRIAVQEIAVTGMKGRVVVPQIHIQRYVDGKWRKFSKVGYIDAASTDQWVQGVFSWKATK